MAEATITFKLDGKYNERLAELAEINHRSKSAQIRLILESFLDNNR